MSEDNPVSEKATGKDVSITWHFHVQYGCIEDIGNPFGRRAFTPGS